MSDEAPLVPGMVPIRRRKGLTGVISATIKIGSAWPGCLRPWGSIDRARHALGNALSDAFAYRFVYVDEIPRSAAGKFEEVKSALGDPPT